MPISPQQIQAAEAAQLTDFVPTVARIVSSVRETRLVAASLAPRAGAGCGVLV